MSLVPMGGHKVAPNPTLVETYPDVYLSTGLVAENHARESGISREEQDAFALRSHQRAIAAIDSGRFAAAVVVTSAEMARERGLTPLARFVTFATAGVEPERFGIGPVPAMQKALKLAGLSLDQI